MPHSYRHILSREHERARRRLLQARSEIGMLERGELWYLPIADEYDATNLRQARADPVRCHFQSCRRHSHPNAELSAGRRRVQAVARATKELAKT